MSSIQRILSGSVATWARLGVTFFAQILLVPIFLCHWDQPTYGLWLAIQAAIGLVTIVDIGHQTFLGFEFLRLGADQRNEIARIFYSALPIGILLGLTELIVVFTFVSLGLERWLFGGGGAAPLIKEAGGVLLLQSVVWLFFGSVGGIVVRLLTPFGYYPRFSWWGVVIGLFTTLAPAIAVVSGASLWGAGVALAVSTVSFNIPMVCDILRIMRLEGLRPVRSDWALGTRNLARSGMITLKTLLEMARQQGARLVLSPLAGAGEMAAFATMRTGANVALQGLGTITNPLMPELMRFLNQRDQARSEAAFGTVWLIVAAGMAPAVVVLQALAPGLFVLWTHGKIAFDPILFAMLSLGVLVYALAQPAMAVVQGHNLLRAQMVVSALAGAMAVGGMCLLVPLGGIRGAALALLLAEVVALAGYAVVATRWMGENGLRWPHGHMAQVAASVATAGVGMLALAWWPSAKWSVVAGTFLLLAGCLALYWRSFPEVAKGRILALVGGRLRFLAKWRRPRN